LPPFRGRAGAYVCGDPGWGFEPECYRAADFARIYRRVKSGLERFLDGGSGGATLSEPNEHCGLCAWRVPCDSVGEPMIICVWWGNTQGADGGAKGATLFLTLAALAQLPLPLALKRSEAWLPRMSDPGQARIQMQGRAQGKPLYETLLYPRIWAIGTGGASPGDVFFDLEAILSFDEGASSICSGMPLRTMGLSTAAIGRCRGRGQGGVETSSIFGDGAPGGGYPLSYLPLRTVTSRAR